MTPLDAALRYADIGLSVIPLRGKVPMFDNWPEASTVEPTQIERWWRQTPAANVGIVTGAKSRIFVLDEDPRHGGRESLDSLWAKHGRFPSTWQDVTGTGGRHFYFRYPAFKVGNRVALLPGLDIRGDHGQVVAPPSVHPETQRLYEWDGVKEPWDDKDGLADAPTWLLEMLQPPAQKTPPSVPHRIPHGVQHITLVSFAAQLRKMGLSPDEIFPSLLKVNDLRCEQPGPPENIRKIADSMAKYQPHDRNLYNEATKLWRLTRWQEETAKSQHSALEPIDGLSLLNSQLKPVHEVVEGVLYNGVTILAGPPKSGKSYLTLCMAISVAAGARFLGRSVGSPGRVAYFALEESKRRTLSRLQQLTPAEGGCDFVQNIEFLYAIKSMAQGGLADLEAYLGASRPSLVILDTLMAFVTGDRNSRSDVFRQDYREIKALQDLATKHDTAILVVHHTNKVGGQGVGAVAGTHGVTAAADCIWTMERQPNRRAVLQVTGREVEDQSFLMELELREPVGWMLIDQGDEVVLSGERQVILEVLRSDGAKSPKQLAVEIGKNPMATRQLLRSMLQSGQIIRNDNGTYRIGQPLKNQEHWTERDRRDE